jgi:hypothetical protein
LSGQNDVDFGERQKTAMSAKAAMINRFRARPKPDDPAVVERQAALQAISVARVARIAERKVARKLDAERHAAEQAALIAEQAALVAAETARTIALAAENKAARDSRYAARKARPRR